jgi:polyisoprenoid-binding protein YceI
VARYVIDPDRSRVWIDARSSLHPIHSETKGLEGWVDAEIHGGGRVNLTVTPKASLELPVELLSSGNALYDREMRRRMDARRFPTISGELTEMKELDGEGRYDVRGDLSFHGVTQSVDGQLTISPVDDRTIRLQGEREFDIRDFGLDPPKILTLRVYPEVNVRVEVIAERA